MTILSFSFPNMGILTVRHDLIYTIEIATYTKKRNVLTQPLYKINEEIMASAFLRAH